jgi:hypothetical protein
MDELKAHAKVGTAVADDAAGADFATGDVEQDFGVSARGKGIGIKQEHSAYAELFWRGNVAFAGTLPGYEHAFGRAEALRATAFVFLDFDGESL